MRSTEIIEAAGIDLSCFPPVCQSGTALGHITPLSAGATDIASARIGITIIGEERLCSGRLVHKRQSTGHDGFHKIRKAFCVLSRLFGYAAEKCSDFLCFNDANCFPISTEQIIGFALLRSMSPGRDLM